MHKVDAKQTESGLGDMVGFYKNVYNEFKPKGSSAPKERTVDEGIDCSH